MSIYAVGDIQGCYTELEQMLRLIQFDSRKDQLWLVGDLVNRGSGSLQVLRLIKSMGDAAITVLGNHDLHLLAVAAGVAKLHPSDTLDEILAAPDRDELLTWLRQQRMLHVQDNYVLLHAGLLPGWSMAKAQQLAHEVEQALRGADYITFLEKMYGNTPHGWDDTLTGYSRLRVITNALSRMRICSAQGEMQFKFKGELGDVPEGFLPWFDMPQRATADATVVFGHWSALGLIVKPNVIALDTGCLWGGVLTAIRLQDRKLFQVKCSKQKTKKDWQ
ncbi:MAG TPA: symmetrical bis(5'-nucleosyl)-tetraphosphatase [Gallionellaceae bacterium]|nr:symmetrical bis(5'-nucleosyl)-tetraphosphatase [Gallionellaceae bacterium]